MTWGRPFLWDTCSRPSSERGIVTHLPEGLEMKRHGRQTQLDGMSQIHTFLQYENVFWSQSLPRGNSASYEDQHQICRFVCSTNLHDSRKCLFFLSWFQQKNANKTSIISYFRFLILGFLETWTCELTFCWWDQRLPTCLSHNPLNETCTPPLVWCCPCCFVVHQRLILLLKLFHFHHF